VGDRRGGRGARPIATWLVVLAAIVGLALVAPAAVAAQSDGLPVCPDDVEGTIEVGDSVVSVIKVSGLIDPVVADFVLASLGKAEADGSIGLVLWLDSKGSVIEDQAFTELASALADSPITVAMWVGQSGSTAQGGAAELLGVADVVGVAPGSTIGDTGPARLPDRFGPAFGEVTERLETATITGEEAAQLGLSVGPLADVALLGPFLTNIDGYEVFQCIDPAAAGLADGADPDTIVDAGDTGGLQTFPVTQTRISGLPVTSQLFHTVASPEVAYLFLALGLGLVVFELFTAGVGIAGMVGAGFLALAGYGLAVLPTRPVGLALMGLAFLALAVDVQTNVPRFYTVVGVVAFITGTFLLYDGVSSSWVTSIVGIIGVILYAYAGMPAMVRTRFSTPTIGRKWMVGEMGEAVTDVSPEGTVRIREVPWRATTHRATPVKAGDRVRVVGLDRLLLEIEPEEGGARDYRERR
jgi:membrane-bound serine protease (ClpP class)